MSTINKARVGETTDGRVIHLEDITPTWSGMINSLIVLVESGTPSSKAFAQGELRRLARIADKYIGNEIV